MFSRPWRSPPAFAQIEDSGERNKTFVEARGNVRPVRLPPGGPTPRMSDGKPDLSGVWFSGPTGRANAWSIVPDEPRKEDQFHSSRRSRQSSTR